MPAGHGLENFANSIELITYLVEECSSNYLLIDKNLMLIFEWLISESKLDISVACLPTTSKRDHRNYFTTRSQDFYMLIEFRGSKNVVLFSLGRSARYD